MLESKVHTAAGSEESEMYKAILGSKPGKEGEGKQEVVLISCLLLA